MCQKRSGIDELKFKKEKKYGTERLSDKSDCWSK